MSHLQKHNTSIENLTYLKRALNRMNVDYSVSGQNIILPQTENKNAFFIWNKEGYTLIYDLDFWTNSLTVNSFTEKVIREYSTEKVIDNMNQFGFNTESYKNSNQSDKYQTVKAKDLVLSRYSF